MSYSFGFSAPPVFEVVAAPLSFIVILMNNVEGYKAADKV
jgi:hypothetical protein